MRSIDRHALAMRQHDTLGGHFRCQPAGQPGLPEPHCRLDRPGIDPEVKPGPRHVWRGRDLALEPELRVDIKGDTYYLTSRRESL